MEATVLRRLFIYLFLLEKELSRWKKKNQVIPPEKKKKQLFLKRS